MIGGLTKLNKALLALQASIRNPLELSKNPHYKSKYVKLEDLLDWVKPELTTHGLLLSQYIDGESLVTNLVHAESGEMITSSMPLTPDKKNMQGVGSAITYARRYAIETICGITGTEDDDGNNASSVKAKTPSSQSLVVEAIKKAKQEDEASLIDFMRDKGLTSDDIFKLTEEGLQNLLKDIKKVFN